jgi:hypothetical protein
LPDPQSSQGYLSIKINSSLGTTIMSLNKIFISFILFLSILGVSSSVLAEGAKKKAPEVMQEVDAKIQAALDAIPGGNAEEVVKLIKATNDNAAEMSANYKFEFERDKFMGKLKSARDAAKKGDLPAAEQQLKVARESLANLKNYL